MQGRTHILGGLAAAGVALSLGLGHPMTLVLAGGFGGLVPDWCMSSNRNREFQR
jgi:membrane-bound metal-dependent hydrolase YbcI (DUF457 family)